MKTALHFPKFVDVLPLHVFVSDTKLHPQITIFMQIHSCSNSSLYSGETCQQIWCINSCVTEAETLMLAKHATINHRGFAKDFEEMSCPRADVCLTLGVNSGRA